MRKKMPLAVGFTTLLFSVGATATGVVALMDSAPLVDSVVLASEAVTQWVPCQWMVETQMTVLGVLPISEPRCIPVTELAEYWEVPEEFTQ